MKKLSLLLACMMVFASIATVCVSASDATYTAAYAETKPVIDGVYDAAWDAAVTATADVPSNANMGSTQPPVFKLLHDETYIYCLMQYTDTNGTITQTGKHNGEKWDVGAETAIFAFIDDEGQQQEFMFTSPAEADGALSTNVYINVRREWVENLANVPEDAEGFFGWSTREGEDICWEMRIPREKIGTFDDTIRLEVTIDDSGAPNIWSMEGFAWAAFECLKSYKHLWEEANFGTLVLAAQGEVVDTEPVETEPVETEPVETEPVETEPVETEPVETEPVETEPVETEPETDDTTEAEPSTSDEPADSEGGNALVYALIAVGVIVAVVVVVLVVKAKKKAK